MSNRRCTLAAFALFALASATNAQPVIAADAVARKVRIDGLRAELAACGDCYYRPLLQARLNQMLKMSIILGDAEPAAVSNGGSPPPGADYATLGSYLNNIVRNERNNIANPTENRVKLAIIDHCKAMNDLQTLTPLMTPDEVATIMSPTHRQEANAKIEKCIPEYDVKQIIANRKTSIEYCLKAHNYLAADANRAPYDTCISQNDMLQAMCNQQLRLHAAYQFRDNPGGPPPQACPSVVLTPVMPGRSSRSPGTPAAPGVPAPRRPLRCFWRHVDVLHNQEHRIRVVFIEHGGCGPAGVGWLRGEKARHRPECRIGPRQRCEISL